MPWDSRYSTVPSVLPPSIAYTSSKASRGNLGTSALQPANSLYTSRHSVVFIQEARCLSAQVRAESTATSELMCSNVSQQENTMKASPSRARHPKDTFLPTEVEGVDIPLTPSNSSKGVYTYNN